MNFVVKRAEEFVANSSLGQRHYELLNLGTANYRAGHFKDAAQYLEQSIAANPSDLGPGWDLINVQRLFLAMTKWQLGERDAARQLLAETQPAVDKELQSPESTLYLRALLEVLRREAEALVEPKEASRGEQQPRCRRGLRPRTP
jgi:hypothetical protein